jgi:Chaperone of endosialidase
MNNRKMIFGAILSVLVCFVLLPQMRAAPDTFTNSNTWDGFNALGSGRATNVFNTANGWESLALVTTAGENTGYGAAALALNTTGSPNTAVGAGALTLNTTGSANNAVGAFALFNHDSGSFNNAFGREALFNLVSNGQNNAFGDLALLSATTAFGNSAFGDDALDSVTTGSENVGVGDEACNTCTTGHDNVAIGHNALNGTVTASNNIAIGVPATGPFANLSFTAYIGSIHGLPTSNAASTLPVLIDSNNVLGTSPSSRRYKHDIKPVDKASEALYALKPISFVYNYDESRTTLYGLIAEDVAKVNTSLVAYIDGKPFTVKYDQVNMLLLNEFLKEHKKVEEQQASIRELKSEMQTMVAQLKEQAAQIQKVSAQLEVRKTAPQVVVNKP